MFKRNRTVFDVEVNLIERTDTTWTFNVKVTHAESGQSLSHNAYDKIYYSDEHARAEADKIAKNLARYINKRLQPRNNQISYQIYM